MLSSWNKVIITETAIYKDPRGILLNMWMLFHQDILNGFQVIEGHYFVTEQLLTNTNTTTSGHLKF